MSQANAQDLPLGQMDRPEMERSRSGVLSYLLKLKRCLDAKHQDLALALTHRFCQATLDYVSSGQYYLLSEFRPEPHQLVTLDRITRQILKFEALYAGSTQLDLEACKAHLEELALAIEVRFEIEDEIVTQNHH